MPDAPAPRRAPTLAGFLVLGTYWGAWAAVLPSVQRATGASKAQLGLALAFTLVGSLPAMLFVAGPAVDRFGPRVVTIACVVFAGATTLPGLAGSLPVLAATLTVAGAGSGVLDVGINARTAQIETQTGKRMMPLAHGMYSVGILAGAAGAGFARQLGAGREPILLAVSVLIGATAFLLATDHVPHERQPIRRRPNFERALLLIGLVAAAAFLVEGGVEGWSSLLLERTLHADPAISGLGPGLFGGAMALGRFGAQGTRLADRPLFVGGAALAAAGCTIAAVAPNAPVALAGIVLAGLGVSVTAPIVFGTAGRDRADAASAVSTVTTLGYVGLLVASPFMGGTAQAATLRGSFALLALLAAGVAALAFRLPLRR